MRRAALRLQRERDAAAQPELLESLSTQWVRTERMRRFLAKLEVRIPPASRSPAMAAWFKWAQDYLDQLDPLSNSGLANLRRNAESVAPHPLDDEPWDPDEQTWRDMGWLDDLLDDEGHPNPTGVTPPLCAPPPPFALHPPPGPSEHD